MLMERQSPGLDQSLGRASWSPERKSHTASARAARDLEPQCAIRQGCSCRVPVDNLEARTVRCEHNLHHQNLGSLNLDRQQCELTYRTPA
jgi:hypothetical protein